MNEPRQFQNPTGTMTGYNVGSGAGGGTGVGAGFESDVDPFDPLDISKSATGFDYKGIDSLGAAVDGFVTTTDMELARKELERAGIRVSMINPRRMVRQKVKKPTMIEFASLAEQFGDLMEIGEPPTAVCRLLAHTQTNKYLADAL